MSGSYTGNNLRLIHDMIAYFKEKNLPGLLLNIDFEKAFPSVDWKFMFKVLKAFGFKKDICRWIETFYTNFKSTVIVNGQPSEWFPICRGCRQGDRISPYLFILCVEILGIMIRENKHIKSILLITLTINSHNMQTMRNFFWHATGNHLKPALQLLIILEENLVYI